TVQSFALAPETDSTDNKSQSKTESHLIAISTQPIVAPTSTPDLVHTPPEDNPTPMDTNKHSN
ncbi:15171_t:CDS:1, partial [Dentiscutata heterogama]